jgi:cytochrome c oxidase assembly factor CtaG
MGVGRITGRLGSAVLRRSWLMARMLVVMRRLAPLLATAAILAVPTRTSAHGGDAAAPSFPAILLEWRMEPIVLAGLAIAAIAWLVLVRRVAVGHPDHPHPAWRSAAFLGGLAIQVLALTSPI